MSQFNLSTSITAAQGQKARASIRSIEQQAHVLQARLNSLASNKIIAKHLSIQAGVSELDLNYVAQTLPLGHNPLSLEAFKLKANNRMSRHNQKTTEQAEQLAKKVGDAAAPAQAPAATSKGKGVNKIGAPKEVKAPAPSPAEAPAAAPTQGKGVSKIGAPKGVKAPDAPARGKAVGVEKGSGATDVDSAETVNVENTADEVPAEDSDNKPLQDLANQVATYIKTILERQGNHYIDTDQSNKYLGEKTDSSYRKIIPGVLGSNAAIFIGKMKTMLKAIDPDLDPSYLNDAVAAIRDTSKKPADGVPTPTNKERIDQVLEVLHTFFDNIKTETGDMTTEVKVPPEFLKGTQYEEQTSTQAASRNADSTEEEEPTGANSVSDEPIDWDSPISSYIEQLRDGDGKTPIWKTVGTFFEDDLKTFLESHGVNVDKPISDQLDALLEGVKTEIAAKTGKLPQTKAALKNQWDDIVDLLKTKLSEGLKKLHLKKPEAAPRIEPTLEDTPAAPKTPAAAPAPTPAPAPTAAPAPEDESPIDFTGLSGDTPVGEDAVPTAEVPVEDGADEEEPQGNTVVDGADEEEPQVQAPAAPVNKAAAPAEEPPVQAPAVPVPEPVAESPTTTVSPSGNVFGVPNDAELTTTLETKFKTLRAIARLASNGKAAKPQYKEDYDKLSTLLEEQEEKIVTLMHHNTSDGLLTLANPGRKTPETYAKGVFKGITIPENINSDNIEDKKVHDYMLAFVATEVTIYKAVNSSILSIVSKHLEPLPEKADTEELTAAATPSNLSQPEGYKRGYSGLYILKTPKNALAKIDKPQTWRGNDAGDQKIYSLALATAAKLKIGEVLSKELFLNDPRFEEIRNTTKAQNELKTSGKWASNIENTRKHIAEILRAENLLDKKDTRITVDIPTLTDRVEEATPPTPAPSAAAPTAPAATPKPPIPPAPKPAAPATPAAPAGGGAMPAGGQTGKPKISPSTLSDGSSAGEHGQSGVAQGNIDTEELKLPKAPWTGTPVPMSNIDLKLTPEARKAAKKHFDLYHDLLGVLTSTEDLYTKLGLLPPETQNMKEFTAAYRMLEALSRTVTENIHMVRKDMASIHSDSKTMPPQFRTALTYFGGSLAAYLDFDKVAAKIKNGRFLPILSTIFDYEGSTVYTSAFALRNYTYRITKNNPAAKPKTVPRLFVVISFLVDPNTKNARIFLGITRSIRKIGPDLLQKEIPTNSGAVGSMRWVARSMSTLLLLLRNEHLLSQQDTIELMRRLKNVRVLKDLFAIPGSKVEELYEAISVTDTDIRMFTSRRFGPDNRKQVADLANSLRNNFRTTFGPEHFEVRVHLEGYEPKEVNIGENIVEDSSRVHKQTIPCWTIVLQLIPQANADTIKPADLDALKEKMGLTDDVVNRIVRSVNHHADSGERRLSQK